MPNDLPTLLLCGNQNRLNKHIVKTLTGFSFLILLFLAGCSSTTIVRPSDPLGALRYDIDQVLTDSTFTATAVGIKVQSLKTTEVLYDRNSRLLLHPASNMKLLTSAAGLSLLGPDFTFKTAVLADSFETHSGIVNNLFLKGYGNPDFTTADIETLAAKTARAGVRIVAQNLVADVSYFDSIYWGAGWMWDDEPDPDEMFISPLSVNKNCVTVRVIGSSDTSTSPNVSVEPSTSFVQIINESRSARDSVRERLNITRPIFERTNVIRISGELLADTSQHIQTRVSVWKPELYALHLFREALIRRGISILGNNRMGRSLETHATLALHERRLDSVLVNLNKISDNLSAENLLRTIAAERSGAPGSARAGIYLVHSFLSQLGIDTTTFLMVDGSGVSHYNLLSAEMLLHLLTEMHHHERFFPLFFESLPVAGKDGTLRTRMKGTLAEQRVHAKTGLLSGVSSLSGYVTTVDGEMLAFSMLMQNFIGSSAPARRAQDRICEILTSLNRTRTIGSR
jgi:D-alanyl-D-alanine carboxypeptidase/D-alanyl-D-alanine-endopeptidase (penicillin-binding protein 4)